MVTTAERIGGIISFRINGEVHNAKGSFEYNLGRPKREMVQGADGPHGYKEMPQTAFIQGAITDRAGLDLAQLLQTVNGTVTLELGSGKVIILRGAFFAGEGNVTTEEGEIAVRFEGSTADEV